MASVLSQQGLRVSGEAHLPILTATLISEAGESSRGHVPGAKMYWSGITVAPMTDFNRWLALSDEPSIAVEPGEAILASSGGPGFDGGPEFGLRVVSAQTFILFFVPIAVAAVHAAVALTVLGQIVIDMSLAKPMALVVLVYLMLNSGYYLVAKRTYVRALLGE